MFDLAEHRDRLRGVEQGDVLRRADDDRAGERQHLRERQRDVARARGHVDDEVVERSPERVAEHLRDRAVEHRPPPDDRLARRHQKSHRHHRHRTAADVELHRHDLAVVDLRPAGEAEQVRHARAVDVGVEQADRGCRPAPGRWRCWRRSCSCPRPPCRSRPRSRSWPRGRSGRVCRAAGVRHDAHGDAFAPAGNRVRSSSSIRARVAGQRTAECVVRPTVTAIAAGIGGDRHDLAHRRQAAGRSRGRARSARTASTAAAVGSVVISGPPSAGWTDRPPRVRAPAARARPSRRPGRPP